VPEDAFDRWLAALEKRHYAELTFPEVRKGLQALSTIYTLKRDKLPGNPIDGRGKQAAFALFYGVLHFLVVRHVLQELGGALPAPLTIADLGCGTGIGGAAWAIESGGTSSIVGIERNSWAQGEAKFTFSSLGLKGRVLPGDMVKAELPGTNGAIVAAWSVNELDDAARAKLLPRLLEAHGKGARVLVVEPIARASLPWWDEWARAFQQAGGRADEWKWRQDLPEPLTKLDRAAKLDHRQLSCRSLWLG